RTPRAQPQETGRARAKRRSFLERLLGSAPAEGMAPAAQASGSPRRPEAQPTAGQKVVGAFGLFRNPRPALTTGVCACLPRREADAEWFDGTVLIARKAMKRLYALLHIKPGERAQKILFDEDPPPDSRLFALRELTKANTPAEQARAIIEHRIPYRVAATVVQ